MAHKNLIFRAEARKKILRGAGALADAMEKIGAEGAITVEEAKTTATAMEVVEGMQFDRGSISPHK